MTKQEFFKNGLKQYQQELMRNLKVAQDALNQAREVGSGDRPHQAGCYAENAIRALLTAQAAAAKLDALRGMAELVEG